MNEIDSLLKTIKTETGISVSVAERFENTTKTGKDSIVIPNIEFENCFQDAASNKTYFKITYGTKKLICVIEGADETAKNYAQLIAMIVGSSDNKENSWTKSEYLKNLLVGNCNHMQCQKYMRKFSIPNVPCVVLTIQASSKKLPDLQSFLQDYNSNGLDDSVVVDEKYIAFVKYFEGEISLSQSPMEFAQILYQSIFEEIGAEVKIGIGSKVSNVSDSAISFSQSIDTLHMSESLGVKSSVHSYKEYAWINMIEELPKAKIKDYLGLLLEKDARSLFDDEEIISTVEEFLDSSLNVSETARKLFMHRNTLMYRLDKIERNTGLNIKRFSDAITFRLISILIKLSGEKV